MKYFEKIDGLRCIAISAVLVHHTAGIFSTYIDWGYFGVDLFFIISGFLITTILLKTKGTFKKTFGRFIGRRSLRIIPLYYFVVFLLYILGEPAVHKEIIYLLTYTFNYRYPIIEGAGPIAHFWSLGVEEQFYLFWPFIVLGLKNNIKILMSITVLIISFAYIQIHFNIISEISKYNYTGLPTRMGSLGLGSIGAIFYLHTNRWKRIVLYNKNVEYLFILIWVYAIVTLIPFLMGLASLFFVLKSAENSFSIRSIGSLLSHKYVLYIAKISYGLYVYHVIVIYYFTPYIFDPLWHSINFSSLGNFSVLQYHSWLIKLPLYSFISIVIADLSYRYFEKPLLDLKHIYFNYKNIVKN